MTTDSPYREAEAQSYDRDREHERHWAREHDYVRVLLGHAAPARVLDVPVGTGRFLPLYSRVRLVAGLDLSTAMLAEAKRRARGLELSQLVLMHGSVDAIPFGDRSFDLTLCFRLMHLIPEAQLDVMFSELARVSAGRVCVQAYVRGPLWLRARGRLQRIANGLGQRRQEQPWAHIAAFLHPEQALLQAASRAGLTLLSGKLLDYYYGSRVMVYEWKVPR